MLARTTTLIHPSGERIETPLLVPSFSSKGFGADASGISETREIVRTAEEYLTDSMLVSAYDIHHGHIDYPKSALTNIVIVDSGGYETSDLLDMSATFHQSVSPKDWDEAKLFSVLDAWPPFAPAIFVSFDDSHAPLSLRDQIERARRMAARYPRQLHAFLAKPETKGQQYVQMGNLLASVRELAGFHVIGVTEKELGNSAIERMKQLASLRLALDEADMENVPIHVFGSLDPVSVCLYFLAGAEIFDGLTWLRYAYLDGMAVYRHNAAARLDMLARLDVFVTVATMQGNLSYLTNLTNQMRKFLNQQDFSHLSPNDKLLYQAYELLRTKMKRSI